MRARDWRRSRPRWQAGAAEWGRDTPARSSWCWPPPCCPGPVRLPPSAFPEGSHYPAPEMLEAAKQGIEEQLESVAVLAHALGAAKIRTATIPALSAWRGILDQAAATGADLIVVDLKRRARITKALLHTITPWSVYEGWEVTGWPVMTLVRGNIVMEWPENAPRAKVTEASHGQYLRRQVPDVS